MSISEKIIFDLKDAMKKRDTIAVDALRLIKSQMGYKKIEKGEDLDDKDLTSILATLSKQWKDGIEQFERGDRQDLVVTETAKLEVLQRYLPKQLTDDELSRVVDDVIDEVGASSKADFGKAMQVVMERVRGQAEGAKVKEFVAAKLT
ncbi:MAG: GatB/YqeY domain-containing protein [candidate division Zixibacteria bacterium]|nr:GatB/YqeY domain-containing protein [candidate division Zixibacteria bacterium]